jgi:hypothetical protein
MNLKERLLNTLDGVLLALAMAWTLAFASALLNPGTSSLHGSAGLRAPITTQAANL